MALEVTTASFVSNSIPTRLNIFKDITFVMFVPFSKRVSSILEKITCEGRQEIKKAIYFFQPNKDPDELDYIKVNKSKKRGI